MTTSMEGVTERLVVLSLSGGQVFTMATDGSDRRVIVTGGHMPDGVAVDADAGHIYWTNMGVPNWTTAPSSVATSTAATSRRSSRGALPTHPSRSASTGAIASSTGPTARACA